MVRKPLKLATAEEIRAIAERALAYFDNLGARAYEDDEEDEIADIPYGKRYARQEGEFRAAKEALRFCGMAAGLLGDGRLIGLLSQILEEMDHWNNHAPDDIEAVAEGLTLLLKAGAPVEGEVEELAVHRKESIRAAVAEGLTPSSPRAIALLEKLATDPMAEVRRPAKESLAEARDVPWWTGKFASDPLARLSPEEAARHKAALEKVSAILDEPRYLLMKQEEELAALMSSLPDALAVEATRIALSVSNGHDARLPALGAMMLSREGGIDAFLQVCEAWSRVQHFLVMDDHVQMVAGAPPEVRDKACFALARYAAGQPEGVRKTQGGPAHIAAEIAGKAFPPSGDLGALLDIVLGIPELSEDGIEWVISGLTDAFEVDDIDPAPLAGRLLEARLKGFSGRWKRLSSAAEDLLAKLPVELLRPAAEQALRQEEDDTVRWGLERLIFEAYDPARDPEPLEMVRRFCEDPRFRRILLHESETRNVTIAYMRAALRRGELGFRDAAHVLGVVDGLWGGMIGSPFLHGLSTEEKEEEEQRELRERFEAFLGPEELHGPITEEEWTILRHARGSQVLERRTDLLVAFSTLPVGPWHPEDRAMIEAALEACEAGKHVFAFPLATALSQKAGEEDMPLFERLLSAVPDDRYLLRRCRAVARDRLGIVVQPKPEGGDEEPPQREWMDEPDDDAAL